MCVWIGVWMWRSQESRWGRSNRGQNLLLKPSSDSHMQRRSDLRKLLALAPTGCYQFPPALRQMCCTWVAPNPLCLDAEIMFQPIIFLDSWVHAFGGGGAFLRMGFRPSAIRFLSVFFPLSETQGDYFTFLAGDQMWHLFCAPSPPFISGQSQEMSAVEPAP